MKYDYKAVEAKWQKVWEDEKTFHAEIDHKKPKFYALVDIPVVVGQFLSSAERFHPCPEMITGALLFSSLLLQKLNNSSSIP